MTTEPKRRGPPRKYATEEERREAKRQQSASWQAANHDKVREKNRKWQAARAAAIVAAIEALEAIVAQAENLREYMEHQGNATTTCAPVLQLPAAFGLASKALASLKGEKK